MQIVIKKLGKTVEVDFEALPQASKEYVIAYGLKQTLNDSLASAKTQAEMEGQLGLRLDRLLEGTMGIRVEIAVGDPIEAELTKMVKAAFAKKKVKPTASQVEAEVAKYIDNEEAVAVAKANIAQRKQIALLRAGLKTTETVEV